MAGGQDALGNMGVTGAPLVFGASAIAPRRRVCNSEVWNSLQWKHIKCSENGGYSQSFFAVMISCSEKNEFIPSQNFTE